MVAGPPDTIFGPNLAYLHTSQALDRISPNTLYAEIALGLLQPATRALGPVLYSQIQGALLGTPLPGGAELPVDLAAADRARREMILIFAIAYVVFQRQEIRA